LTAQSPNGNGHARVQDLAWRVGGPQGSGVDTAALIFQRACGIAGLHLYGRREYYSNIMGRHSYYDVRASELPRTSHRDAVDLLTTFEAETLSRHIMALGEGSGVIYRRDDADVELHKITYLDARYADDLAAYLAERDLPPTTAGQLQDAENRGVKLFAIDFDEIVDQLAEAMDVPQAIAARARNTLAVAVSTALLDFSREYVHKAIAKTWPGRQKIIDLNVKAVDQAYEFVDANYDRSDYKVTLHGCDSSEKRMIVNGNQAVALGKLAGGIAFQSYYPISPATDESVFLEAHEEFSTKDGGQTNVVVVQTEDEISAVTMAAGAALTGARSSTATSGPGFALMCEGMGWAGINEVPLVVTDWQRGAPSTGMPTRTEQGDLRIATTGAHGDFPIIVVASGDVIEAFYDAAQCFNYADRYQSVVVHILDKALSSSSRTVPYLDTDNITIDRGEIAEPRGDHDDGAFHRFAVTESGVSPRTLLGQKGNAHWCTGGEHTPEGRVTEDPVVREAQIEKRQRKMELALREIPLEEKVKIYGDRDADMTILSWGSNKGAILECLDLLEAEGTPARFLHARLMKPFPVDEMTELLEGCKQLVIVEANFTGQYAELLRANTGVAPDHLVLKYNGRPISAEELIRTLHEIREGDAPTRIVLRNPYQ
jgi:2-oxoglutarate ferredoxin oxidoreductase subunit alpha